MNNITNDNRREKENALWDFHEGNGVPKTSK